jgi:hypothetical protein
MSAASLHTCMHRPIDIDNSPVVHQTYQSLRPFHIETSPTVDLVFGFAYLTASASLGPPQNSTLQHISPVIHPIASKFCVQQYI